MSFKSDVYKVLIASPGDTEDERVIIPDVINDWNASSAEKTGIILMPVKWETHSVPALGDRPQEIINKQIVNSADLLVGIFWTRIGTQTGKYISGTVEEIEQFVNRNKPVMLYFSEAPINPNRIDVEQFTILRTFKDDMRLRGLIESYSDLTDFRNKFTRQLSIQLNNLIDGINSNLKSQGQEPSKKVINTKREAVEALKKLSPDEVKHYLITAFKSTANNDGWSNLSAFAKYLLTYTPVKYTDFGFNKLKPYLESTKLFEFKEISKTEIEIRMKTL